MKVVIGSVVVSVCLAAVLLVVHGDASAEDVAMAQAAIKTVDTAVSTPVSQVQPVAKKCGFDSDCPHGKCKGGKCGSCGFDSDCKGWGKCKSGMCGACGFDSDCKGFGKCSSGKCTKSPY